MPTALTTFNLPPEASNEIFTEVAKSSAFQQVARRVTLPGTGTAIPVLGKVEADWVGARGDRKKIDTPPVSLNQIQPYTLAVIIPVHKDMLNDYQGLLGEVQTAGVSALAEKFDSTVAGESAAPGSNFHTFADATEVVVTDRTSFINALKAVNTASGRRVDSIVITSGFLYSLMAITSGTDDKSGVLDITGDRINGVPYVIVESIDEYAIFGAFKALARWGTVDGISIEVSNTAVWHEGGEIVSAFETNLVACRIEARYGFQVANEAAFVKAVDSAS